MTAALQSLGARLRGDAILSRLLGGGLAALAIKVGAAGLSFVMFIALARAMDPQAYGRFGFGFSAATVLAVIGSFGLRNLTLRFGAIYSLQKDHSEMAGLIRHAYLRVAIGTGSLGIAVSLIGVASNQLWLAGAGLLTLGLGLGELQPHILRASTTMTRALFPRDVLWRLMMIALATLAITAELQLDAQAWLTAGALTLLVITVLQFVMNPHLARAIRFPTTRDVSHWRAAQGGLWGSSIVMVAGPNLAIVILGLILGPAETGPFFAALRTAMLLNLFLMASNMVAAPMISAFHSQADRSSVQRICRLVVLGVGLPSLFAFLGFVAFGARILDLFGPGFGAVQPALVILASGYLVSALAGPTMQILEMQGDAGYQLKIMALTTTLSLLALAPLAIAFGPLGAALALAGNTIAWNVIVYRRIWRHHGIAAGVVPASWMGSGHG